MNPRLLLCLLVAILAALGGAVGALLAGWGIIAALLIYSFGGAAVLVLAALILQPGSAREPKPAPKPAPAADAKARAADKGAFA